jgi:sec-independent protein translocase protein TatA
MSLPGGWELVLVVLVIMVLFGAKRLPDASRSLGRSMRIFKAETKGLRDDDTETTAYDAREHDRQVYDRTIGSPPPVPPVQPVPGVPPVAPGESTDPAQPRQP